MIEAPNMMEHDDEPVRGLPAPLPEGERLLWQGRPDWWSLAQRGFHVRGIGLYFALLMVWRGADALTGGASVMEAVGAALWLTPLAAAGLGLLMLLAWLSARATVYTITTRRIVIRSGVALQLALNLPYKLVGSACLKVNRDGTGDIPLNVLGSDRISYLILWPHVRPWRMGRPEPMLRCVPDAAKVADTLSRALAAYIAEEAPDRKVDTSLAAVARPSRQPRLVSSMGSAQA